MLMGTDADLYVQPMYAIFNVAPISSNLPAVRVETGTKFISCWLQALKDLQMGNRILYVICAEGKANKNITIANLVINHASHQLYDSSLQGMYSIMPNAHDPYLQNKMRRLCCKQKCALTHKCALTEMCLKQKCAPRAFILGSLCSFVCLS